MLTGAFRRSAAGRALGTISIEVRKFSDRRKRITKGIAVHARLLPWASSHNGLSDRLSRNRHRHDQRAMSDSFRTQQRYNHPLRQRIKSAGHWDLTIRYGIPRSPARDWLKQGNNKVVSIDMLDTDAAELQRDVLALNRRTNPIKRFFKWALSEQLIPPAVHGLNDHHEAGRGQNPSGHHRTAAEPPPNGRSGSGLVILVGFCLTRLQMDKTAAPQHSPRRESTPARSSPRRALQASCRSQTTNR